LTNNSAIVLFPRNADSGTLLIQIIIQYLATVDVCVSDLANLASVRFDQFKFLHPWNVLPAALDVWRWTRKWSDNCHFSSKACCGHGASRRQKVQWNSGLTVWKANKAHLMLWAP